MDKIDLIKKLQEQLSNKEEILDLRIKELQNEYDTQKYINELLGMARKDINTLAEYISIVSEREKEKFLNLMDCFITNENDLNQIFQEAKNLRFMKKRNFDLKGVPQYNKSKLVIDTFYRRLNQYNLTRNYKYTSINQINELKSYLERVIEAKTYFNNGRLVKEISDIKEIEYIIEKSDLDEQEKTEIIYVIAEENNKFYLTTEGGETNAIETN